MPGLCRSCSVRVAAAIAATGLLGAVAVRDGGAAVRPSFAWGDAPQGPTARTSVLARPSLCAVHLGPESYRWPVKPFTAQHPIRAFFGDPRTIFRGAADPRTGSFSFHNGVDIVADDGTSVYPVLTGIVTRVAPDEISVSSDAGRRIFQYWHLKPLVRLNARVRASATVLGTVRTGRGHVHLSEIDDQIVENPLQPGHLMPYRDNTAPSVEGLYVRDELGRPVNPEALSGTVDLAAAASDAPPAPLAPPWSGIIVAPARVSWELSTLSGDRLLSEQTQADFTLTIPPPEDFRRVYDDGTYQNFPAVGAHYFYGTPGDYLFELTPTPLDTRPLLPGRYRLTVTAVDTCGNRGTLAEIVRVLPQPGIPPLTDATVQSLGARTVWPRRFWTIVTARAPARIPVARVRTGAGETVLVGGVYRTWADAYAEAQHLPGAYPREIVQRHRLTARDWPRQSVNGRYTVVLASLPAGAGTATALELRRAAARRGLPSVQVVRSALSATLRPGYLVIVSGRYATARAATRASQLDATFYAGAYMRELVMRRARPSRTPRSPR